MYQTQISHTTISCTSERDNDSHWFNPDASHKAHTQVHFAVHYDPLGRPCVVYTLDAPYFFTFHTSNTLWDSREVRNLKGPNGFFGNNPFLDEVKCDGTPSCMALDLELIPTPNR